MIIYQKTENLFISLINLIKFSLHKKVNKEIRFKFEIILDENLCNVCKLCVYVCKSNAIEDKVDKVEIHKDKCIYCLSCGRYCPKDAIEIKRGESNEIIKNN